MNEHIEIPLTLETAKYILENFDGERYEVMGETEESIEVYDGYYGQKWFITADADMYWFLHALCMRAQDEGFSRGQNDIKQKMRELIGVQL